MRAAGAGADGEGGEHAAGAAGAGGAAGGSANVIELLAAAARRHPERPALVTSEPGGRQQGITYGALWQRVRRVAAGLRQAGLAPGERAIVMIPMSIDLYVALLALLELGAVAVFVDPWIGWRQVAAFAAFASPAAYLGTPRSHLLRWLSPALRRVRLTVTTGRRWGPLPAGRSLAELAAAGAAAGTSEGAAGHAGRGGEGAGSEVAAAARGDAVRNASGEASRSADAAGDGVAGEIFRAAAGDPALITFTSGSSGEPKGANRTHGFLRAQHLALAAEFPLAADDVDLTMFPVFALRNLASGVTSVVPAMDFARVDRVDGAALLAQMEAHGVTTCTASPPFFDRLAAAIAAAGAGGGDAGGRPDQDLPPPAPLRRLRRLLTGGAPVADEQLALWRRALPETEIVVVYGSTEAEPVAHLTVEERLALCRASAPAAVLPGAAPVAGYCVGPPCAAVRARVIRIHGGAVTLDGGWAAWEVPAGEVGELVVAGDHVCQDYFRNPEAVAENKIRDAEGVIWHRMGDTGRLDAQGRFWLAGRVHSTIWRAGRAVHPQLVEQAAAQALGRSAQAMAAVGLPDEALGERVVLVIEGEEDAGVHAALAARLGGGTEAGGAEPGGAEPGGAEPGVGIAIDEVVFSRQPLPRDPRHRSKVDYAQLRRRLLRGGGAGGRLPAAGSGR